MSRSHQNSSLVIKNSIFGLDDSVQLYLPFTNHANDVVYGTQPTINSNNTITENGIAVEEATMNICPNPDGKSISNAVPGNYRPGWDTTLHNDAILVNSWGSGYNSGVPSPTIGYHAKWVYEGIDNYNDPCMKFIDRNDTYSLGHRWLGLSTPTSPLNTLGVTTGDLLTISWLQKTDVAGKGANVGFYRRRISDGAKSFCPPGSTTVYASGIGKWEKASMTFAVDSDWDLTQGFEIYVYGNYGSYGTLWVDNVQVEKKAFATSFVNGSRSLGILEYNNILRPEGTVNFDFVKDVILTSGYQMPFRVGNNVFEFNIRTNVYLGATVDTTSLIHIGERHTATISWSQSGNSLKTYLDGAVMNSATCPSYVTQFGSTTYPKMYIGCGDSGGNFVFDGVISDFILFNRALSDDEVKTLSNSPFKYNSEEGVCL